ncbi:SIS domain-containing protein [Alicyclobacillaceae bacterium I2511]|nr:SIS domain-containing protein [Alicyclobacillaceae bacterium I2511]
MESSSLKYTVLRDLLRRYPKLQTCSDSIFNAFKLLYTVFKEKNKILVCGNGGSAADAEHIVGELMKGFSKRRVLTDQQQRSLYRVAPPQVAEYLASNMDEALPAISLVSQTSLLSAIANDLSADVMFAQQVLGYGEKGDILLGISTSGNSKDVVLAAYTAKARGMKVIALTGQEGGTLASIADVAIQVPETEVYQIQELHLPVYHALCRMLENELFLKNSAAIT